MKTVLFALVLLGFIQYRENQLRGSYPGYPENNSGIMEKTVDKRIATVISSFPGEIVTIMPENVSAILNPGKRRRLFGNNVPMDSYQTWLTF